jgi:hypothetical protein
LVKYALNLYHEALSIDPLDPDALTSCAALSAFCTGEGGAAEAMLERAVSANPAHLSALCNYGQLLLNKGFSMLAARDLADACEEGEEGAARARDGVHSSRDGGRLLRWMVAMREEEKTGAGEGRAGGEWSAGGGNSTVGKEDASDDDGEEEEEVEPEDLMRRGVEALERVLRESPDVDADVDDVDADVDAHVDVDMDVKLRRRCKYRCEWIDVDVDVEAVDADGAADVDVDMTWMRILIRTPM